MMQMSFHRSVYTQYSACPLGPDVPSSLGALEWGLLVHLALIFFFFFLHELTLNIFLAFPGIFWLGCQLPCRQDLHQCPYAVFHSVSLSPSLPCSFVSFLPLSLSSSLPGPTSLYLLLLSILGGIIETLV